MRRKRRRLPARAPSGRSASVLARFFFGLTLCTAKHGVAMILIEAEAMGMCFGVRDALAALDHIAEPATATIHGELVHNPLVLQQLSLRGFRQQDEADRAKLPDSETVVVTAHGISEKERRRLRAAGKRIIDTT